MSTAEGAAVATSASGSTQTGSSSNVSTNAKMEALLEQLRAKHSAGKSLPTDSWNDFAKQIRMASLDSNKRRLHDPAVMDEALEKLQGVMTAHSLSQMLERINSACQKLGLKYSEQGSTVYISTDLFYVDLKCDTTLNNQSVRDVHVTHHGSQPTSVPAMTQALRQANVKLFMDHIKGFMDVYNVDSEQSLKTKFFIAQQSLESDIEKMNKVQMQQQNINLNHIYKLPLGLVQARNGGLPTKLTFFITPYDCLNEEEQTSYTMTMESVQSLDLGTSATIGIEHSSTEHQLQTIPLSNYNRGADNRLGTTFVPSTNINSVSMPAAFVLKFKKPIALSKHTIKQIERLQGSCEFSDSISLVPMLDAIVQSSGVSIASGTKQFTVVLPGQVQNYYINELKTNDESVLGGLVTKLPFTHPTFIPPVIALLRHQLMLNTMILSCVRSGSGLAAETKAIKMELKVVTDKLLTVTFKHPFADSVATVDFDITDVSLPKCAIYCNAADICSNSYVSKVLLRSFSIPITMRAILRQSGHQEENLPPPSKKVKADHGETMQKISDVYTSRGHYLPYGSVNTSSTRYTKNIQTNKYPLCMRRFSGYKRSCFSTLNTVNSVPSVVSTKPSLTSLVNIHPIPAQASDKLKLTNTPMLSSLLDEKAESVDVKPPAHPLAYEPTQGNTPQQYQASLLSDLLEGPEGLNNTTDKKPKKIRQKRRTSDGSSIGTTPPAAAIPARKRKKSDNEEIVRELTSKVKSEVTEQQAQASHPRVSLTDLNSSLTQGTATNKQTRVVHNDSHLMQLLDTCDDDKKAKPIIKTKIVTLSDMFESPNQMKQEALLADVKTSMPSVTVKAVRPKKAAEEKKIVKHSASADAMPRDKKLKRSDSMEMKAKESRSVDQAPPSPGKKTVKIVAPKVKVKPLPKSESLPPLTIKTSEDRASPKEKVKKQGSEKEKKKRAAKSPVSTETSTKQSSQDLYKQGFYGVSLKSFPKIPKRKPGESQNSPTSPTAPPLQQKSPVPVEWQRSSPILNRSLPSKSDSIPAATANRTKSFPSPGDISKRPALLPTPPTAPIEGAGQRVGQRKGTLNEMIHRLSQSNSASQPPRYSTAIASKSQGVDPSPNSPDELSIVLDSQPVCIPTQPVTNNPASPLPEIVTQAPKSIPLNTNKVGSSSSLPHKPILIKQKAVSRPLTFSSKPSNDNRLDDDLMDAALGCT